MAFRYTDEECNLILDKSVFFYNIFFNIMHIYKDILCEKGIYNKYLQIFNSIYFVYGKDYINEIVNNLYFLTYALESLPIEIKIDYAQKYLELIDENFDGKFITLCNLNFEKWQLKNEKQILNETILKKLEDSYLFS